MDNKGDKLQLAGEKVNEYIKLIVNAYLEGKGEKSLKEMFEDAGGTEKQGTLPPEYVKFMQLMLIDEYKVAGVDLPELITSKGETMVFGQLTEIEKDIIFKRVQHEIYLVNYIAKISEDMILNKENQ